MLCAQCGAKEATTHIKKIINGSASESHYCTECAAKLGYASIWGPSALGLGDLLGGFFGGAAPDKAPTPPVQTKRCPSCGADFAGIVQSGKVGCADCYTTFYEQLLPTLERMHGGKARHVGKQPETAPDARLRVLRQQETALQAAETASGAKLAQLRAQQQAAIARQDFEKAAELRDRMRALAQKEDAQ